MLIAAMLLTFVLHTDSFAFACCKFVPDLLRLVDEVVVALVSLLVGPWTNQLPLAFSGHFVLESLFQFDFSESSLLFWVQLRLLTCQDARLHLCFLLFEYFLAFAHRAV